MIDYPAHKLIINRLANLFLRIIFHIPLNDYTNAFKAYRRTVIDGCRPFLSPHFNLTMELPLKTIVRGYSWTVSRSPGVTGVRASPSSRSGRWAAAISSSPLLLAGEILFPWRLRRQVPTRDRPTGDRTSRRTLE